MTGNQVNNPLVSVCMPAYNSEKWIGQTIKSVLNQSWKNIELIIVDDGSVDNTLTIIKQFESPKVKIISQVNSGACVARNKALGEAQGDFIQWLDADDILAPDKIEIQLRNSDMDPGSLILHSCAWGFFYYCTSRTKFVHTALWKDLSNIDWLTVRFGENIMMPNHSFLVSRRLTELAGPWNEELSINQDGEYFTRVITKCKEVKFHTGAKCYYRKGNPGSISTSKRKIEAISKAHNLCIDHLLNYEDNQSLNNAAVRFLQDFVSTFYFADSEILNHTKSRILTLGGKIKQPFISEKFKFISNIFGLNYALKAKLMIWYGRVHLEKHYDRFLNIFWCK